MKLIVAFRNFAEAPKHLGVIFDPSNMLLLVGRLNVGACIYERTYWGPNSVSQDLRMTDHKKSSVPLFCINSVWECCIQTFMKILK